VLAPADSGGVDPDPAPAPRGDLDAAAGQAGRPEVLHRADRAGLQQLQAGLEQQLLEERVPDLDGRSLLLAGIVQLGRGERRPVDPVPPGRRPDDQDDIARVAGPRAGQLVLSGEAHAHRVDQRVLGVARVEEELTADGGDPDTVAVVGDAGHDAVEQVAVAVAIERSEAERVEDGDRAGAHREDVAQDPAHAGRRALERLDGAGMVVRFHLQHDQQAVADVDRAGVLAGALHDAWAAGREPLQECPRVLVPAVLAPHGGQHPQLDLVRLPAEALEDVRVLRVAQLRPRRAGRPARG
jgi:hypothetical protein